MLEPMSDEAAKWSPEQVRPGQVRRDLSRGTLLAIDKIEDGSVHGTARDLEGAGTVAVCVLGLEEVSRLPLIFDPEVPTRLVTAPLPIDQSAAAIYDEAGTYAASRTHTLTDSGLGGSEVQIEVVAPDGEVAKERVAALGARVGRKVLADEMRAERLAASSAGI